MINESSTLEVPKSSKKLILLKRLSKILSQLMISFLALSICTVLIYRFIPVPYTPLMFIKSIGSQFDKAPLGIEKKWVPIEQIARPMQLAVIKAEDAKFYMHNGFDFEAIEKAMKYNKTHKKQKGASTISQQTAKNTFLWPARSWIRKGMEVYFTVMIECLWSKTRILEVYLNIIELGPGVYGVEAAAEKYFHKKAKNLSRAEAALVAAVLPNPIKFKINRPSAYILRRQQKILGKRVEVATNSKQAITNDSNEFFDIKFDNDNDEEADDGVDSTPSNE